MKKSDVLILINKKLGGEITYTEECVLQRWLDESAQNQEIFNQFYRLWKVTQPGSKPDLPDVDKEWRKLSTNLGSNGKSGKAQVVQYRKKEIQKSKNQTWPKYLAMAAVLILALGLSMWSIFRPSSFYLVLETKNAETRQLNLEDGSMLNLNHSSKLTYPAAFTDSVRLLNLEGEAFFNVVSDGRPFIVETKNAKICVLGTEFNIWSRNNETRVIVKIGRVSLQSKFQEKSILLKANQMGVLHNQKISDPINITSSENMIGWLRGRIVFNQTSLKEVVEELNRIYDLTIQLENTTLENLSITGNFEKKPIQEVLEAICLTLDLKFKQTGGKYIIFKQ